MYRIMIYIDVFIDYLLMSLLTGGLYFLSDLLSCHCSGVHLQIMIFTSKYCQFYNSKTWM